MFSWLGGLQSGGFYWAEAWYWFFGVPVPGEDHVASSVRHGSGH